MQICRPRALDGARRLPMGIQSTTVPIDTELSRASGLEFGRVTSHDTIDESDVAKYRARLESEFKGKFVFVTVKKSASYSGGARQAFTRLPMVARATAILFESPIQRAMVSFLMVFMNFKSSPVRTVASEAEALGWFQALARFPGVG
jgi:hypothetical protein